MVSPKFASQPVDRVVTDAAHEELAKFVELGSPGVVDKRPDTVLNFDNYLKTPSLQKTNAMVEGFLNVGGVWERHPRHPLPKFHFTDEGTEYRQETRR